MKWSVTLTDRLGPEMLTVLEIKGQVLHRVRLHVKVPGLLLNLNALLTKKLPKFLSRLNEMSGGKENMCLVSGSEFHSHLPTTHKTLQSKMSFSKTSKFSAMIPKLNTYFLYHRSFHSNATKT